VDVRQLNLLSRLWYKHTKGSNDLDISRLLTELLTINDLSGFTTYFQALDQTVKNTLSIVGVFTLIAGLLQCFLGFKLLRVWCAFVGFLIGGLIGVVLAATVIASGAEASGIIGILFIVGLGLLGALIAYKLYLVGVFVYAFVAAFSVGFILLGLITDSIIAGLIAGLMAGITMGIVAVVYRRFWIIVATSVSGGISAGTGFLMMIQSTDPLLGLIIPLVFIIAGFIVQNKTVPKTAGLPLRRPAGVSGPNMAYRAPPASPYPPVNAPYFPPGHQPTGYDCPNCGHVRKDKNKPCGNCGSML